MNNNNNNNCNDNENENENDDGLFGNISREWLIITLINLQNNPIYTNLKNLVKCL